MNERANVPALMVGGSVSAIIPQSVEEMFRVAQMVVQAGIAPVSLTGKEPGRDADDDEYQSWGKKASSAVAAVIMSGAELGLPPMVALRSFTVIGGRPALYGDGLINVVRRHGKAEYVRTGCDTRDGQLVGWCEAKRRDTGETKRVEFSEADARRAGLWDNRTTRRGKVWKNNQQVWDDVPNDSTWFRYPQRMLAWRAAGYCLRELFADVLGGITDEFEAREIAGEYTREDAAPARLTPPSPPSPPSPPAATTKAGPPSPPSPDANLARSADEHEAQEEDTGFSTSGFLQHIDDTLSLTSTEEAVIERWDELDVEATLTGDDDALQHAFDVRKKHFARVERAAVLRNPINGG